MMRPQKLFCRKLIPNNLTVLHTFLLPSFTAVKARYFKELTMKLHQHKEFGLEKETKALEAAGKRCWEESLLPCSHQSYVLVTLLWSHKEARSSSTLY